MGLYEYLKNGFTTGESAGMPTTKPSLLNDPLFQIGLGILSNSQGNSFGAALGKGGLQAFNNLQQQSQIGQQNQLRELQMQEAQQKLNQAQAAQKAKDAFKLAHPEYADAVDLDPTLAIKAAYPQIAHNSADPYYTVVPTEKGIARFNARDGSFELIQNPDGSPYVKSTDSPSLQGQIAGAKSYNSGLFKPNNDVNGVVSTDAQVAMAANPALNSLPYVMPDKTNGFNITPFSQYQKNPNQPVVKPTGTPANFPRVSPQEQAQRDDLRLNILLDEQKKAGGVGQNPELDKEVARVQGIRVPTKAELAGSEAQAKADVELGMQPQIEAAKKSATMQAENKTQAQIDLPNNIAQAEQTSKLVDDLLAHKGFKSAVGFSSYNPLNMLAGTDAKDFNIRLDQLKGGQFLQAYNMLKGGGSITEVEGKKATDAIARMNTASSEEEFVEAAKEYQQVIKNGIARAKLKAGVSDTQATPAKQPQAMPMPAKPSALTLKAGAVYNTAKGALRWNGKQFEDL